MRDPLSISFAVWRAIFLHEALGRMFGVRFAWFWLLVEPILHIVIIAFVFALIRVRTVGNVDVVVWLMVGMLAFFLFRRTAVQVTYAVDANRALFTYRQVKPFDPAIARAALEAFLMATISVLILGTASLLGHDSIPTDPLLVLDAAFGLWLFGFGYGLVASVLIELVPETKRVLDILMVPLYLLSGVIWPMVNVPLPYRDLLMLNPIPHGIELLRLGFFPYYHTVPGLSMSYLYACGVTSVFFGLVLYRRFAIQLVMR